jgi:hypothetical protein
MIGLWEASQLRFKSGRPFNQFGRLANVVVVVLR